MWPEILMFLAGLVIVVMGTSHRDMMIGAAFMLFSAILIGMHLIPKTIFPSG